MFEPHWAFVSRAPCERCAKVLVDIGVKRVFYFEDSRPMREGFLVFDRAGVVYAKAKLGGATA
jgi:deoxycytidylate deaminase